jgi:hypothetical protein
LPLGSPDSAETHDSYVHSIDLQSGGALLIAETPADVFLVFVKTDDSAIAPVNPAGVGASAGQAEELAAMLSHAVKGADYHISRIDPSSHVQGNTTSSPLPVPAAYVLFCLAVVVLGRRRWRKDISQPCELSVPYPISRTSRLRE